MHTKCEYTTLLYSVSLSHTHMYYSHLCRGRLRKRPIRWLPVNHFSLSSFSGAPRLLLTFTLGGFTALTPLRPLVHPDFVVEMPTSSLPFPPSWAIRTRARESECLPSLVLVVPRYLTLPTSITAVMLCRPSPTPESDIPLMHHVGTSSLGAGPRWPNWEQQ
jgi:hypothetical protein